MEEERYQRNVYTRTYLTLWFAWMQEQELVPVEPPPMLCVFSSSSWRRRDVVRGFCLVVLRRSDEPPLIDMISSYEN